MEIQLTAEEKRQLNAGYNQALADFDKATCEAMAVSQAIGVQMAEAHIGHSTYVFLRICNHAASIICSVPRSRWVRADFEHWDFGGMAGHSRAILEGYLLFLYLVEKPGSAEEWSTKINVMFLNDCTRRIKMMGNAGADVKGLEAQADELRDRLTSNPWFAGLAGQVKKRCLSGDNLMIPSRDEMLENAGWEKQHFYAMWDLLSQYAHALPISFFRMEPNGRGTGLENDVDKAYIARMLDWCAETLTEATNRMVEAFPGTAEARKGTKSKFSPGPRSNRPGAPNRGKIKR
ncbi:hypothetical protein LOY44_04295 [Pseudomonas sp. B21-044]|uniref:hypothetical protein n=1 Tax=Pseudomonas sp. B21-044 TaxID=2895488 RepID=UPI00215F251F|nr:hypothetical protein [Pseudomonas sp. B21-044]UVL20132.1 hypothetical protein LOY44_04295 [Pseudomonas sp. B21-044]